MRCFSLLAWFALALPAAAAPPKLTGPAEVKPGGFAEVEAEGAKLVDWTVTPDPVQVSERPTAVVFTGTPGVEYTVTARVIDFDARTLTKVRHVVKFLDGPARPLVASPPPPPGGVGLGGGLRHATPEESASELFRRLQRDNIQVPAAPGVAAPAPFTGFRLAPPTTGITPVVTPDTIVPHAAGPSTSSPAPAPARGLILTPAGIAGPSGFTRTSSPGCLSGG